MVKIKSINNKCSSVCSLKADLLIADPPFEMNGVELFNEIKHFDVNHYILFLTMKQIMELSSVLSEMEFCFDMVWDLASPKKSKSYNQPFYNHVNVLYFKRKGVKSVFNRTKGNRRDTYTKNYFPTIIRASKASGEHGHEKNIEGAIDLLSFFDIKSAIDAFSGSGTFTIACAENDIDCVAIEIDIDNYNILKKNLKFYGLEN